MSEDEINPTVSKVETNIGNLPQGDAFPTALPEKTSAGEPDQTALLNSLTRLLAGGALTGSDFLVTRLRHWEQVNPADSEILDAKPDETDSDRNRYAILGMLLDAAEAADKSISVLSRIGGITGSVLMTPVKAVGNSWPLRPAKKGFDRLVGRGEQEWERWVQKGRVAELRSRRMTQEVVTESVDEAVTYFSSYEEIQVLIRGQIELLAGDVQSNPELDNLVKALASNYIAYLQAHPEELDGLVRVQADEYLDHLHEHPEEIQDLIAGQSLGLASTIRDEIRQRTVSFDIVFEKLVRGIMRKTPRNQLPSPPKVVQDLADSGYIPGDTSVLREGNQ